MRGRGPWCVAGCYVLWGLLPVFWRQLDEVNALYVLAARIVWSLAVTAAVLALRPGGFDGVRRAAGDRRERRWLMAAGVVVTMNWGLYIWAVNSGHMLDASLAYYMSPIQTILLGTLVFRESLSRTKWAAVAVAALGLVVTVAQSGRFPWLALAIGGTFAVYGAIKKKVQADGVTAVFFETLTVAPAALAALIWMESRGMGAGGVLHGARWLLLPAAGLVTTVPLVSFAIGMKTTSLTLSGILMYINPTLELLISVWLYQEEFTAAHGMLFGFVWSGLALYVFSQLREDRRARKEEGSCV